MPPQPISHLDNQISKPLLAWVAHLLFAHSATLLRGRFQHQQSLLDRQHVPSRALTACAGD